MNSALAEFENFDKMIVKSWTRFLLNHPSLKGLDCIAGGLCVVLIVGCSSKRRFKKHIKKFYIQKWLCCFHWCGHFPRNDPHMTDNHPRKSLQSSNDPTQT